MPNTTSIWETMKMGTKPTQFNQVPKSVPKIVPSSFFEKDTCTNCHFWDFFIMILHWVFGALFGTIFGTLFGT